MFRPCGSNFWWTSLNNQSLAANPPTRTTCWNAKFKTKGTQEKQSRHTEIGLWAFLHCSNTAFTMHSTEGSKKLATSDPRSLSWPNRMLQLGSLSLVPPNLIYGGSSEFRNLSFVALSKQPTICSMSVKKEEFWR